MFVGSHVRSLTFFGAQYLEDGSLASHMSICDVTWHYAESNGYVIEIQHGGLVEVYTFWVFFSSFN